MRPLWPVLERRKVPETQAGVPGKAYRWNPELIGWFRGVGSECRPISTGCRSAFVSPGTDFRLGLMGPTPVITPDRMHKGVRELHQQTTCHLHSAVQCCTEGQSSHRIKVDQRLILSTQYCRGLHSDWVISVALHSAPQCL